MHSKQDLRKQLHSLGVSLPPTASKLTMQTHLNIQNTLRNHDLPTPLAHAWTVLLTLDDAFWIHFADIRVLAILAQTCRAFRFQIPENEPAWEIIAKNMHRASKACMAGVFRLPARLLSHLPFLVQPVMAGTEAHLVSVHACLHIAWKHHGGARGVHASHRTAAARRTKKGSASTHARVRWGKPLHTPTARQHRIENGRNIYLQNKRRKYPAWNFTTDYVCARTKKQEAMLQLSINREISIQRNARARHGTAPFLSDSDIQEIHDRIHNRFYEREMIRVANQGH